MPIKKGEKTPNPKRAAQNYARGMSKRDALIEAGYSESTANKSAAAVFNRPLVQSELTRALKKVGVTFEKIVQPIADGLRAKKSFLHNKLGLITTDEADHLVRLAAADRAIDLMGGIPKVGESVPTSTGLNVFVAIDNGATEGVQPRPAIHPQQVEHAAVPEGSTKPGTAKRNPAASSPAPVQSTRPASRMAIGISIIQEPERQGSTIHPIPLPNGHANGKANGSNGHGHQHAIQPSDEF